MKNAIVLAVLSSAAIQIGLITSDQTSDNLFYTLSSSIPGILTEVKEALSLSSDINIVWVDIDLSIMKDESKWTIPTEILDSSAQVILDAGSSIRYSNFLSVACFESSLLHIVISRPINTLEGETPFQSTLFAETCYVQEATVMLDLVNFYGWRNLGIIQDQNINNVQMANTIKNSVKSPLQVKDQVILNLSDASKSGEITYRLQSTTKESGARIILVMSLPRIASEVLKAADKSFMGGYGYVWILNTNAMENIGSVLKNSNTLLASDSFGVLKTGALGIRAVDDIYIKNDPSYPYLAAITIVCQAYKALSNVTGPSLRNYFLSNPATPTLPFSLNFDSSGIKKVKYSIFNIKNFAEIEIGSWDPDSRQFRINSSDIVWPGFSSKIPNDTISAIQIGLLYPLHDNTGAISYTGRSIRQGFDLAINEINNNIQMISGYQFQPIYADTFEIPEIADFTLSTLTPYNIIGYVGPSSSALCQSYYKSESLFQDPKPMITYFGSSTTISDSNAYPTILQMVQPDGLQAVALTLFIQQQNWEQIGVIYTLDEFGIGAYNSFLANIGTLSVVIINSEAKRGIVFELNEDGQTLSQATKSSVEDVLSEIVRNQIKVIIYLGNTLVGPELAKQGNNKELVGEEYAWVGTIWLTDSILKYIDTYYPSDKESILNVFEGAIGLEYSSAIGTTGAKFASNYYSAYKENYTTEAMLTYDAVYTFGTVITGIIARGDDFNSGVELMNSLRSADLTGASGLIKFSEGSNGRSAYGYNFVNFKNGKSVTVLEYDPLNPNLFTVVNNQSIVWGGNSSTPPISAWPNYYDCPFAEHMSKMSPQGLGIIITIGASLFFLTLSLSFFSFKKWKQLEINLIKETVVRSWKDTLVQAQIVIEFFQFIAIAPNFSSLKIVIQAASNIFMLDIMKVASSNKGDYWILLTAVCVLCYIWFILVIIIMLNGEHWLKKVPFCKRILSLLNSVFLPFYGNTFFLPALALLLDMFVCDHRAQGNDYVWRDCYTICWDGKHRNYIYMSSIAIICYEPIAAYSRPLWQQSRTGLNLKIQPFFLLVKTCCQILLIAIGKSLQSNSPVAHGVVYTILISIFTVFIYKTQPFNYHRCNLWEFSSMVAVCYLSFLATLSYSKDPEHVGWFIALIIGWLGILGWTIYTQKIKMPNLLVAQGGGRNKPKIYDILSLKEKHGDNDLDQSKNPDMENDDNGGNDIPIEIDSKEEERKVDSKGDHQKEEDLIRVISPSNVQKF